MNTKDVLIRIVNDGNCSRVFCNDCPLHYRIGDDVSLCFTMSSNDIVTKAKEMLFDLSL